MRKVILSVLSTLVVVGLIMGALFLYATRGHGFSAREQPTWMERTMARNARKIATPADANILSNPRQQQTTEMIAEADEPFVEHCGVCHGIDGRGDTTIGRNLDPKVPDMSAAETQQLSDGEMYYIISNGIRLTGMPAWGSEDKPEAIWDLVSLIRRLPKLSPEETKRLQDAARNAGGELSEQAPEKKEPDQMPCYCHCDRGMGHRSLHSCFEDDHAAYCATCVDEALMTHDCRNAVCRRSKYANRSLRSSATEW